MKKAFGMIDLLLGLLIITVLFLIGSSTLRGFHSVPTKDGDIKSIQEHVDEQVRQIENMRKQTMQYNNNQDNL